MTDMLYAVKSIVYMSSWSENEYQSKEGFTKIRWSAKKVRIKQYVLDVTNVLYTLGVSLY